MLGENYKHELNEENILPSFESVPEKTEAVRENRAGLLKKIFSRKGADIGLNMVPGVDVAKLAIEAVAGRTLGRKKLEGRQRTDYAIIAGVLAVAYGLKLGGKPHEAYAVRGMGSVIVTTEFGPEFLKEGIEKLKARSPKFAHIFEKGVEFWNDNQGVDIQETFTAFNEILKRDPTRQTVLENNRHIKMDSPKEEFRAVMKKLIALGESEKELGFWESIFDDLEGDEQEEILKNLKEELALLEKNPEA